MPVIYQLQIQKADAQANRGVLYVFGDNLEGYGLGGQAMQLRYEPNAVGIPTKRAPLMRPEAFLADGDFERVKPLIEKSLRRLREHLETGGVVVMPLMGIGTGRAQLAKRAPKIWEWLSSELTKLAGATLPRAPGGRPRKEPAK